MSISEKRIVDTTFCRESKAYDIQTGIAQVNMKKTSSYIFTRNATILPAIPDESGRWPWGRCGVIDEEQIYIEESALKLKYGDGYVPEYFRVENKRVVYCGYFHSHWGHFLMDTLKRMWICLLPDFTQPDLYVFSGDAGKAITLGGNEREFFRLLGILDKVVIISEPTKYDEVVIPEIGYDYQTYYTENHVHLFEYVAQQALLEENIVPKHSDFLFFSRSQFKKAIDTEPGIGMLDNFFGRNGYEICYPERMSLSEMICAIRNSKICAFESGTTPHNMLFAKEGHKTIIIERMAITNNYQNDVEAIRKLNTTYVDGHYTIYPVYSGGGPFFLAYTPQMKAFSQVWGYCEPDQRFLSEKYMKKCIQQYMKVYSREYRGIWGLESWMLGWDKALLESYEESLEVLRPYLLGQKIYSWRQLTYPAILRTQIGKLLSKLK